MKAFDLATLVFGAFALAAPGEAVLHAQDAPVSGQEADSEEKLDEGLKRFGYLAGLARGCVARSQLAALEREVLSINNSITQLLGTDRAFLFATSFGFGTSVEVENSDCAVILKNYEARVAKHRAGAGGAK